MNIDTVTESDVGAALTLSAQAGWGTRERDWRRLVSMDSVQTLAGRIDGTLGATAVVTVYDPRDDVEGLGEIAWIGSIIVDDSYRREGYGSEIFDAALSVAEDRARIVGLDANDQGKSIYEDAGFVDVADAATWTGTLDVSGRPEVIERCSDPTDVATLDTRAAGVDRSRLLRALFDDPTSHAYVKRDVHTSGYVLVRPSTTGWVVGPLVADEPDDVRDLLAAAGRVTGNDPVSLKVAGDSGVADLYRDAGLQRSRTLTRMTYRRRSRPLMGERIRAIAGYVFG